MNKKKGLFISFEGPEAAGKSSQLIQLKKFLIKNKIPFLFTREPGGTIISEKLRNIILQKKSKITPAEEILLLMAGRINHINNVILPAVNKGKLVISDRFADSTFVYQGYVNNFGIVKCQKLHKELINNFLPYKTFLFLLSPNEIVKRIKSRKISNKFDKEDIEFHKKVITGYKKISYKNKRFISINANQSFHNIQKLIQKNILNFINKKR